MWWDTDEETVSRIRETHERVKYWRPSGKTIRFDLAYEVAKHMEKERSSIPADLLPIVEEYINAPTTQERVEAAGIAFDWIEENLPSFHVGKGTNRTLSLLTLLRHNGFQTGEQWKMFEDAYDTALLSAERIWRDGYKE